mmetsp:Transcript_38319/g.122880  ORF Transcript_38319/g.122880 Transcript_38319/m.122880 type:complete len:240 (-) Transcript_38319:840-1559(-)
MVDDAALAVGGREEADADHGAVVPAALVGGARGEGVGSRTVLPAEEPAAVVDVAVHQGHLLLARALVFGEERRGVGPPEDLLGDPTPAHLEATVVPVRQDRLQQRRHLPRRRGGGQQRRRAIGGPIGGGGAPIGGGGGAPIVVVPGVGLGVGPREAEGPQFVLEEVTAGLRRLSVRPTKVAKAQDDVRGRPGRRGTRLYGDRLRPEAHGDTPAEERRPGQDVDRRLEGDPPRSRRRPTP